MVRRFYSHRLPDFASRNRNLMLFTLPGRTDPIRIVATHGDIYSGDTRLADASRFDRPADPAIPCAILGDWNTVPSGPFEPTDLNTPGVHNPRGINYRVKWEGGARQAGPHVYDTRAERPNGRQCLAIDGILLNDPLRDAYVPGSYRVHDFRDPQNPGG